MWELLLLAVAWLVLGCAVALLLGKAIDCGDGGVSKIAPQRQPSQKAVDEARTRDNLQLH